MSDWTHATFIPIVAARATPDDHAAQALYESLGYARETGTRHYSLAPG